MTPRPKSAYHPYILVAFDLNCLPDDLLLHIPRSTKHGWLHKDQTALFGHDWYIQHKNTFDTLKLVVAHKRLLQLNKAFLRVFALQKFIRNHAHRINDNIYRINETVLNNLYKASQILGVKTTLRYLHQSYSWYLTLKRKNRCRSSVFSLCRIKHPAQLLLREVNCIIAYCSDIRFSHWPLASVYHQIHRDHVANFSLSTFYKYANWLHIKRPAPAKRRKNHHTGIRAAGPLQILHADSTVFKTADNVKNYIYLAQDNFSRAILAYKVDTVCTAQNTFDNLEAVRQQYLIPAGITSCQLITDHGSENAGPVKTLTAAHPSITHLIAQHDIAFSNSMIEAANKQLKYRFLYHHHIPDHQALVKYINQAVLDYKNRPHDILHGLTPAEELHGKRIDKAALRHLIAIAKISRIAENKKVNCCYYSF